MGGTGCHFFYITNNTYMKRFLVASLMLITVLTISAQKKSLQLSDYGRFRSVSAELSEKGNVVAFVYSTPRNDDTLFIKNNLTGRTDTIC